MAETTRMGQQREDRLTKKVTPPGEGALPRLRRLGIWSEIERQMEEGLSLTRLARWIQVECHDLTDLSHSTVLNALWDYRKTLPPATLMPILPRHVVEAIEEFEGGMQLMAELRWGIRQQMERITHGRDLETKAGITCREVTDQLRLLGEMVKVRAELAMALGLTKRTPIEIHAKGRLSSRTSARGRRSPGYR